uniref:Uncharacterized protein n=1 Tax=Fusarium oxysporum (strain Fo5176) TaxID=660025 RepID=A0A0D2YEE1_FUSOF
MFLLLVAKLSLQERAGLNSKLKVIHHLRLTPTDFAPVAWEANGLNPGTVSLFP